MKTAVTFQGLHKMSILGIGAAGATAMGAGIYRHLKAKEGVEPPPSSQA